MTDTDAIDDGWEPVTGLECLWTPWAEVLCWPCHGPQLHGRSDSPKAAAFKVLCTPRLSPPGTFACVCDRCDAVGWIERQDVAREQALRIAVGAGRLDQTGGMCSAVRFDLPGGGFLFATDDEEGFCVGRYLSEEAFENGETASWEVLTFDKAREYIRSLL